MGKNPAFQFYPSDWTRDLDEHPLEIEGAWIRIICQLWWEKPHRGKATKDLGEWARILRVSEDDANRILLYIGKKKIGEVTLRVTLGHKIVTVKSRRMYKQDLEREFNRLRQQRYRRSRKHNGKITAPSSVLHTSKKENPRKMYVGKDGKPHPFGKGEKE